jgi:peptide/nickel transport system substrate-binding protein
MDQISATFKLLPDLLWSDGEPLTTADSVYAFDIQVGHERARTHQIARTAAYEALDDLTLVWTGLPGYLDSTYYINFFGPAPEHVWSKNTKEELPEAEEASLKPIGWGPYVIDEWVQGESVTLRKNPNYYRADEGLPRFDTLIYRFVGNNASENIAALLSGECDILDQTTNLADQSELLLDLQAGGKLKATFTTGTVWEHIDFGIQHVDYDDGYQLGVDRPDYFSDVRTRQAFAMCMDRQRIIDDVFLGQSLVIDSYLPPQHPLYNPEINHYDFDVLAGSALLEEIGWMDDDSDPDTPRVAQGVTNVPDGTLLEVSYETRPSPIRQQVTSVIKDSLAQCGIKANVQLRPDVIDDAPEGPIFGRHFDLGEFAWLTGARVPCRLYMSSFIAGPAGETWIAIEDGVERTFGAEGWGFWNTPGFTNEEYDRACNTGFYSLPGQPDYETAYHEVQRILTEQVPIVPLYLWPKLSATRPDLCGLIMDPSNESEFWNIEEFDYGEGCEESGS